jgi:LPXTG-motif cell wall-anchored protein
VQKLAITLLAFVGLSLVPSGISHGQAAGQIVNQGRSPDSRASTDLIIEVVGCEPQPVCTSTTTTTTTTTTTVPDSTTTVPGSTTTVPGSTTSVPGSTTTVQASSVAPSTAAPPTTGSGVSDDLPVTGRETVWLALFALLLLVVGGFSVAFARRASAD